MNLMASLINTEMEKEDDLVIKQVRDFLIRIHSDPVVQGEQYIKDTALDFCKKQKLKEKKKVEIRAMCHRRLKTNERCSLCIFGGSGSIAHKFLYRRQKKNGHQTHLYGLPA